LTPRFIALVSMRVAGTVPQRESAEQVGNEFCKIDSKTFNSFPCGKGRFSRKIKWLAFLDTFRAPCIDPKEEIRATFEAMRNSWEPLQREPSSPSP